MTTVAAVKNNAQGTSNEFGQDQFVAVAVTYREHKRIVDACSGYDNVEDAMAGLKLAWEAIQSQVENGADFTPPSKLGFGSDNARVIGETLLGIRNTVGSTRKAFKDLGKV